MPQASAVKPPKPAIAEKLEWWGIDRLRPYARNSRTHSSEQIDAIAQSMRTFGWTFPILVQPDGTIIAGHARLEAAKRLGFPEVKVLIAEGWSEEQVSAYVIADNQLPELAGWDQDMLGREIAALNASGFDLSVLGFSDKEVRAFLRPDKGDPDEFEAELPADPVVHTGELWTLGQHRLLIGDATSKADVERVLRGIKPHLMVTDPPYGVEYDPAWRNRVIRANGTRVAARATGVVLNDDRADWREAWALFPGGVGYVWHAGLYAGAVATSLEKNGFKIRSQIIWSKSNFAIGRGDYHWQHEPCWYAVKGSGRWAGGRTQTTVWEIDKPSRSETGHSAQKPVECMARPMRNNSKAGEWVYDPFLGSGTTIVAAEIEARQCAALEIDPGYAELTLRRWEEHTGGTARREDGAVLAELGEAPKARDVARTRRQRGVKRLCSV